MRPKCDVVRSKSAGGFAARALLRSILASPDFEHVLEEIDIPPEKLVSPLLSFLYATDELIRWRAVRAVGLVVSRMAQNSAESARNIMRRLMWSLNDESGGIGWGAPEAMGEIMAVDEGLAREYYCILLSYIDECGNPLENDLLERGVLWGIGRLAQARPELVRGSVELIIDQLSSADPVKRGLAVWGLGFLDFPAPNPCETRKHLGPLLEPLLKDEAELHIYSDGELKPRRIADLAAEVLATIGADRFSHTGQ
ncbi:MAG: DVU0298 family protein [Syntrophobacteraceae bacterium]